MICTGCGESISEVAIFTHALLRCLASILEPGGWEQHDMLFVLHEGRDELEYLMQVEGRIMDFLPTLLELGMGAGPGVLGLAAVHFGGLEGSRRCTLIGMTKGGDGELQLVTDTELAGLYVHNQVPELVAVCADTLKRMSRLLWNTPTAEVPPQRGWAQLVAV